MSAARKPLFAALLALVALYAAWFGLAADWVALLVFALPPLWLAVAVARGRPRAGFWAGLLALLWFSHGVMVAWSRPAERLPALGEVALALAVIAAGSLPGLRARFGGRR